MDSERHVNPLYSQLTVDLSSGGDRADSAEKRIEGAIKRHNGRIAAAAKELKISDRTMNRLLRKIPGLSKRAAKLREEHGVCGPRGQSRLPKVLKNPDDYGSSGRDLLLRIWKQDDDLGRKGWPKSARWISVSAVGNSMSLGALRKRRVVAVRMTSGQMFVQLTPRGYAAVSRLQAESPTAE